MTNLLIATSNPGKILEFRALLNKLNVNLLEPTDLGIQLWIDEETDSYLENARRKALAYAQASGCWTLADDSGLEVDALEGLPGPLSARMAGEGASDQERRSVLLKMLEKHPQPWTGMFKCIIALASSEGDLEFGEGTCEGIIVEDERGDHGFGYDPIFQVGDTRKTMAELTMEEKNRLSHRAKAVEAILPIIKERMGLE